ncbi:hypothetical protein AYO40_01055 [Planctomycetaceae bacterium SCGC AG-212-D15]|nr:hypothetical protein AYO40_01055 [Planctomycetaceae bacterium SCGC AG-212-D15]
MVRYRPEEKILEVIFLSNYHYLYYNVEPDVFDLFLASDSPGRFVWSHLRAKGYKYDRVGAGMIPSYRTAEWLDEEETERRKFGVVRALLPEERLANAAALKNLQPGQSKPFRRTPLKQRNWRNRWGRPPDPTIKGKFV